MPSRGRALLPVFLLACLVAGPGWSLDVPRLERRVTDLAGILTTEQVSGLEAGLKNLEDTDSTQIALLIVPSLEGDPLEDFSERVATAWKLGGKGRDNGALLLIAMKERSVRIEVGYGLEATLTDALSRRIIENEIIPAFREGDYHGGIKAGLDAMTQTVRGEYSASSRPRKGQSGDPSPFRFLIFLLFPLLWVVSATGKWGGGILGAGVGAWLAYSIMGAAAIPMLAGAALGALVGAIAGALVRSAAKSGNFTSRGGFGGPFHTGGRGPFRSGGGFGGGFGGGGGFSGGGGSFGGGGASGRW